ncbi:hypothetical protein ACH4B4_42900, partial [Streptomyces tendae]
MGEEDDSFEEQMARALAASLETQEPAQQAPSAPEPTQAPQRAVGAGAASAPVPVTWIGDENSAAHRAAVDALATTGTGGLFVVAYQPNGNGRPEENGREIDAGALADRLVQLAAEGVWTPSPLRLMSVNGWTDRHFTDAVLRQLWRRGLPVAVVYDDADVQRENPRQLTVVPPQDVVEFAEWLTEWLPETKLTQKELASRVVGLEEKYLGRILLGHRTFTSDTRDEIVQQLKRWEREAPEREVAARQRAARAERETRAAQPAPGVIPYGGGAGPAVPQDVDISQRAGESDGAWLNRQMAETGLSVGELAKEVKLTTATLSRVLTGGHRLVSSRPAVEAALRKFKREAPAREAAARERAAREQEAREAWERGAAAREAAAREREARIRENRDERDRREAREQEAQEARLRKGLERLERDALKALERGAREAREPEPEEWAGYSAREARERERAARAARALEALGTAALSGDVAGGPAGLQDVDISQRAGESDRDWLNRQMAETGLTNPVLADLTGLDASTISKVRSQGATLGDKSRPRVETALRTLRSAMRAMGERTSETAPPPAAPQPPDRNFYGAPGGSPDTGAEPFEEGWPIGRSVVLEGPRREGAESERPSEVSLAELPEGVREFLAGAESGAEPGSQGAGKGKGRPVEPDWFVYERWTLEGESRGGYEVSSEGGIKSAAFGGEVLSGLWVRAGHDFFLPGGGFVRGESGWLGRVANGEFYGHPEYPVPETALYRLVVDRETESMYFVPVGQAAELGAKAVRIPLQGVVPVRSGRVAGPGEGGLTRADGGRGAAGVSAVDSEGVGVGSSGVGGGGLSLEEFELVRGVVLAELRGRWGFEGV